METKRTARVLIRREKASDGHPWWVAQVLEWDLATQAKNLDDLAPEVQRMIAAHILCCEKEGVDPFSAPSAPTEYEHEYAASKSPWTINITRAKHEQLQHHQEPDLAFRFAPGI